MAASVIADDVLDRVAGDPDDHDPRERLRDAERLDGGIERVRRTSRTRTRRRRLRRRARRARSRRRTERVRPPRARARRDRSADSPRARRRRRRAEGRRRPPRSRPHAALARSPTVFESPSRTMMKTASRRSVAVSFGSRFRKRITPSRAESEPATIARPSTSSAFANNEPRIDVCATTTSPAESAKRTTNSSGRFPSVDCSTPVVAAPKRVPTASVAIPIAQASPASAAAATRNTATGLDVREMECAGDDAQRRGSRRRVLRVRPAKAGQSPCARTSSRGWARSPRGPCPRPARASAAARPRPRGARCSAPGSARAARPRPRRRPP